MMHKDSSLACLWDQWSALVAVAIAAVCLGVAMFTGPVFGAPYLIVAQFILSDITVKSFSDDYNVFKKPKFIQAITVGSLQVFSGLMLLLYILIIKNLDTATIVLWTGVVVGFGVFGILNFVKAARIRVESQKEAAREAVIEAFKQIAREEEEEGKRAKRKEIALAEESLLESLAFLTDIEPENK